MAIAALVDNLDNVDEALRPMYKEVGDHFILDVEGMVSIDEIKTHPETQGLVSALDKEREARKDFERKNRELERRQGSFTDDDVKELTELRDVKKTAEEERRRQAGEFDSWRDEIGSEHKTVLASKDEIIKGLQSSIRSDRVGRQISEACAEHGAPATLMQSYIKEHVRSEFDDEGTLSVSVVDGEGMRMVDGDGQPLGVGGFVKKLADSKEFGQYFTSKQKSGSGTKPTDRDGSGGTGEKPDEDKVDVEGMSAPARAMHEKKQKIAAFRKAETETQT